MDAAVGPEYLGCVGDPQPCDISEFGCCPDGRTEARGEKFAGCLNDIVSYLLSHSEFRYNVCLGM